VALAAVACLPIGAASAPQTPQRAAVCPIEVIGTWALASSGEAQPMLVTFAPDGWVNVLGASAEGRPQDSDILAQVRYQLVPPRAPKRIEFQARRGNDVFPPGTSSWEITNYTDDSFTSRSSDSATGEQSVWSRLQTHRYFLTFAARDGTAGRDPATFVVWTTLDGQKTQLEALGMTAPGGSARFGRVPDELAKTFATESKRADDVMLRIELHEAEYRRTHQVFEAWDALLSRDALAADDPGNQTLGLLDAALQSVNRCRVKLRSSQTSPGLRPIELVRALRKINEQRHVPDKAFPFRWQPPPVAS
jgi:hypothetical protein